MYRAMGAGPGPATSYYVDLPLPWGKDTEIALPMDQLTADAWETLSPKMDQSIAKASVAIALSAAVAVGFAVWLVQRR
jgi:hypothetical protein